jgi:nucleoside-diphosphate-sugar epimerase
VAAILIAGCGYVGNSLATLLSDNGHDVWGLRRNVSKLPSGIHPVGADLGDASTMTRLPAMLDAVVFTAAPDQSTDLAYRAIYVDGLRRLLDTVTAIAEPPSRLILVSSTSVYGQDDGQWIDEASATEPQRFSGKRLLESELIARSSGMQTTVVRFAGIYGPGRTALVERVHRGEATLSEMPSYTNRIHRDDCAGALAHLIGRDAVLPTVLGVDDDPADANEVIGWLGRRLAVTPQQNEKQNPSRSNKRASNALLRSTGYEFRWPSYRDGYPAIVEEYLRGQGGSTSGRAG